MDHNQSDNRNACCQNNISNEECSGTSLIDATKAKQEANAIMGIGAGVALVGAGSAAILGAVCPLCFIIGPGLIGAGAYNRLSAKKRERATSCCSNAKKMICEQKGES